MEIIKGGITAPKGFLASGVHCGIKKNMKKKDMAVIYSEVKSSAAAVYTQNLVKGEPLLVTMEKMKDGNAQAVIINSGNANTCTGKQGYEDAKTMCENTAKALNISSEDVLVASTGVIGMMLNMDAINQGIPEVCKSISKQGYIDAREAIMTTDTVKKDIAVSIEIDGKKVTIGGMAKGSGMIHPNMATMLSFITTDANISKELLQEALSESVKATYNMISIDGDTSTNDMVLVLANGMAQNHSINKNDNSYKEFYEALNFVNIYLSRLIAKDGEGATRLFETNVKGAKTLEDARKAAKAVVSSSLVKAAVFGSDANWGRVLCALGYCGAYIEQDKITVSYESAKGYIEVYENGTPVSFDEEKAKEILNQEEVTINVELNLGEYEATSWGCDLSYEYVRINGDYRS